eukprot:g65896.t1
MFLFQPHAYLNTALVNSVINIRFLKSASFHISIHPPTKFKEYQNVLSQLTSSLATLRSKFPIQIKSKSARQCFLLRLVLCLSFVRYSSPSHLIAMPQFDWCLNNGIHCDLVPVPTGHISPSIFVSIPVAPWPVTVPIILS